MTFNPMVARSFKLFFSHCCTALHCVNTPQFIYLLLTGIGVVSSVFLLLLYVSFSEHIFIFLLCTYIREELLGHRICICSALVNMTKLNTAK